MQAKTLSIGVLPAGAVTATTNPVTGRVRNSAGGKYYWADTYPSGMVRGISGSNLKFGQAQIAWNPPDAWASTTAYLRGDCVVANSNIYISRNASGTSGSTAPSATTGDITDGTVTWNYVGPTFTAAANAPTVSITQTSPVATLSKLFTNALSTQTLSGTSEVIRNDNWFRPVCGIIPLNTGGIGGDANNSDGYYGRAGFEFFTGAPSFAIYHKSQAAYGVGIEIDGRLVKFTTLHPASTAATWYVVTAGQAGVEKRVRVFYFTCGTAVQCVGVQTPPGYTLYKTNREPSISIVQDSYGKSNGSTPYWCDFPKMFGANLGVSDVACFTHSGSGFLALESTNYSYRNRIAVSAANNPELHIVQGSINDANLVNAGTNTAAELTEAVRSYLVAARAAMPESMIVVTATMYPSYARVTVADAAIRAGVTAADVGAYFIEVSEDSAGSWFGTSVATGLFGADGLHLTYVGDAVGSARLSMAIKNLIATT